VAHVVTVMARSRLMERRLSPQRRRVYAAAVEVMAAPRKESKLSVVVPQQAAVLDPRQEAFLEWLLIPANMREAMGVLPTKAEYAKSIGVSDETLRRWERLPHFREARMKAIAEGIATPEKVEEATSRAYMLGFFGDPANGVKPIPAYAVLWAQIAGLTQQASLSEPSSADRVASMSDAELAALAASGARAELEHRAK
jgi:DNA-binding transcriptional regulator YiaG